MGKKTDGYIPKQSDIEWAKNLLNILKDQSTWGVPRLGTYMVNKDAKTLTLVQQWGPDRFFEMDVAVFGACGYKVSKALHSKSGRSG